MKNISEKEENSENNIERRRKENVKSDSEMKMKKINQ